MWSHCVCPHRLKSTAASWFVLLHHLSFFWFQPNVFGRSSMRQKWQKNAATIKKRNLSVCLQVHRYCSLADQVLARQLLFGRYAACSLMICPREWWSWWVLVSFPKNISNSATMPVLKEQPCFKFEAEEIWTCLTDCDSLFFLRVCILGIFER